MRRSIDGLCAIVQDMFHSQPDTMSAYLFCGKRCERIKILIKEPLSAVFCYPHIFCRKKNPAFMQVLAFRKRLFQSDLKGEN